MRDTNRALFDMNMRKPPCRVLLIGNHMPRLERVFGDPDVARKLFAVDWCEIEARTAAFFAQRDPYHRAATLMREQAAVMQGIA